MDERLDVAIEMKLSGSSYQKIAQHFGISRQRIQQILRPKRATRLKLIALTYGACEGCGILIGEAHGHFHHLLKSGIPFNDCENLQFLCMLCHRRVHNGAQISFHRLANLPPSYPSRKCIHCDYVWKRDIGAMLCPKCHRAQSSIIKHKAINLLSF